MAWNGSEIGKKKKYRVDAQHYSCLRWKQDLLQLTLNYSRS